jgi:hypothetical protein
MQKSQSVEIVVNWIKRKNLQQFILFFLDAHYPVLGVFKHVGIASSFLIPIFGSNTLLSHLINCLSSEEDLKFVRTQLELSAK